MPNAWHVWQRRQWRNKSHWKVFYLVLLCVGSSRLQQEALIQESTQKPHKTNHFDESSMFFLSVSVLSVFIVLLVVIVAFVLSTIHRCYALSIFADPGRLCSRLHSFGWHAIEWNQSRFGGCIPWRQCQWATAEIRWWCKWYLFAIETDEWNYKYFKCWRAIFRSFLLH